MTQQNSRQPCRRNSKAHAAILKATAELLEAEGFAALTIEKIAARAGVGKQTIYRWWPSKATVILEAHRDRLLPPRIQVSSRRSTRDQICENLTNLIRMFISPGTRRAVVSLLCAAQEDSALAHAYRTEVYLPRRQAVLKLLKHGQECGEIRRDADLEVAVDTLYGPLWYRLLIRHAPLDRRFARHLTDQVFQGLKP